MPASRAAAVAAVSFLLMAPAQPAPLPPVQRIEMSSFAYAPSTIHLRAGQPVTLHFVNRSAKRHDFTARPFFAASRILSGSTANGEVDLRGGGEARVTLVPAAGSYAVHCGHPFHKLFGMRGRISVR